MKISHQADGSQAACQAIFFGQRGRRRGGIGRELRGRAENRAFPRVFHLFRVFPEYHTEAPCEQKCCVQATSRGGAIEPGHSSKWFGAYINRTERWQDNECGKIILSPFARGFCIILHGHEILGCQSRIL
jgi:hypothetical protein